MIKINLLDTLDLEQSSSLSSSRSKKSLLLWSLILVVGIGGGLTLWPGLWSAEESIVTIDTSKGKVVLAKPVKDLPKVEPKYHNSVEEVVHDIHLKPIPKPAKVFRITEPLASFRAYTAAGIKVLSSISANGIGFADVVMKTPNYFYLYGIAENNGVYRNFKTKLGKNTSPLKSIAPIGIGVSKVAQSFQFYGQWSKKVKSAKFIKLHLSASQEKQLLAKLKNLAKGTGLKVQGLQKFSQVKKGPYMRKVLSSQLLGNYQQLNSFLQKLNRWKWPVSIQQLSLGANQRETLSTKVDWVYYSK
jgi:hypothetical protein